MRLLRRTAKSLPRTVPRPLVRTIVPPAAEQQPSSPSADTNDETPPHPPESLTVDQVRTALSQWFLSLRYGRHAARILLESAAALIAYHRRHNTEAKLSHARKRKETLLKSGIDIERIVLVQRELDNPSFVLSNSAPRAELGSWCSSMPPAGALGLGSGTAGGRPLRPVASASPGTG